VNIDEHTKIMCFRKEYIETIIWAGSPEKIINKDGHIVYFSPRHSFEAYKQIEKGKSKPWVPIELNTLKQICKLL
jgi:light-regulated signal transduction histidine kinase (bacteriophytochrome)